MLNDKKNVQLCVSNCFTDVCWLGVADGSSEKGWKERCRASRWAHQREK
jgi:hypothetical protein